MCSGILCTFGDVKKGYLSFVIVLIASIIFLYSISAYSNTPDFSSLIISEQVYMSLLDFKHAAVSSTKFYTKAAVEEYLAEASITGELSVAEIEEIKSRVKYAVRVGVARTLQVKNLSVWCGNPSTSSISYAEYNSEMSAKPKIPFGTFPILSNICDNYIFVSLIPEDGNIYMHVYFDKLGFTYCYAGKCRIGYIPKNIDINISLPTNPLPNKRDFDAGFV